MSDPNKCTGCGTCEAVCSLHHTGTVNPSRSRIRVIRFEGGVFIPMLCLQCKDPICVSVCPTAAIFKDEVTRGIIIDSEECIGCKMCMLNCPFGAISIDSGDEKLIKCDLCGGDPTCVKFCSTGALQYVKEDTYSLRKMKEAVEKLPKLIRLATGGGE